MIPVTAFESIMRELEDKPLPTNEYRLIAGKGQSQTFGIVNRRCLPPDYSRLCWVRPRLYKLLLEFGKEYVPIPFNAITVNQNYKAAPHRDKNNNGSSFLVAFGDFTGGELEVLEGDLSGCHNINRNPITTDFSKVLHAVKDFIGTRYSLVYYTFQHKRWPVDVPEPSVREVDGKLLFYRGEELCKGLPHPLKGRKVKKS